MGTEEKETATGSSSKLTHELLTFEFLGQKFGVEARTVDTVIAWRDPVPLPRGGQDVRGVIQDKGRIVAVLAHPAAGNAGSAHRNPSRIIVCTTSRGYVGLPAMAAEVGAVHLHASPTAGAVVDSSVGAITYVDPEELVSLVLTRQAG